MKLTFEHKCISCDLIGMFESVLLETIGHIIWLHYHDYHQKE